jgi:hypothetical protein
VVRQRFGGREPPPAEGAGKVTPGRGRRGGGRDGGVGVFGRDVAE